MKRSIKRNWCCSLVMKRREIPLINGGQRVIDVCRNCGQQTTEIYTSSGSMVTWRNDGKPNSPKDLVGTPLPAASA